MNLLMITRKVDKDDGLAGFSHNWIKKLSVHVDKLYVICQEKGSVDLPGNVEVSSLGKENGASKFRQFITFQKLAKRIVLQVDGIFAHQNPEYGLLAAPYARKYKKKLVAWYTHKSVTSRLRLLEGMADVMVTASKDSFRLPSKKLKVLHHGIDTEKFAFKSKDDHQDLRFLSISRISKTKNIHLMIDLMKGLKEKLDQKISLKIIGVPSLESDKHYLQSLKKKVKAFGLSSEVEFLGSVANEKTPEYYQNADVFLNFSNTGSLDKSVLEAMSCGTIPITSNVAFKEILSKFNEKLFINSFTNIDEKVIDALEQSEDLPTELSVYIKQEHNLDKLINRIYDLFK